MPTSPPRPCRRNGCPNLVTARDGWCDVHRREQHKIEDDRKPKYHRLYKTSRWLQLRARKLQDAPLCQRCGAIATLVHHIKPHGGDATIFYDYCALESLCVRCHELEHRRTA